MKRPRSGSSRPSLRTQSRTGCRRAFAAAGSASGTADHSCDLFGGGTEDPVGGKVGDPLDIVGNILQGWGATCDSQPWRLAVLDAREGAGASAPDLAGALALLATEIGDHRRNVFGLELGQYLRGHQALGHARAGDRRERVHENVVLLALEPQRIHETDHGKLGAAVVGLAEIAVDAGVRRRHHHAAIGLGAHDRPGSVRDVGGPEEVHLHDEVEILDRHVVEGLVAQHAGVVHHDVDRAEGIDGRLDDVRRALGIGDRIVVRHRLSARRLDLGHHLVGSRVVAALTVHRAARIVHHDLRAAAGQQHRMRPAQPIARTGDDGDAIVETNGHFIVLLQTLSNTRIGVIPSVARDLSATHRSLAALGMTRVRVMAPGYSFCRITTEATASSMPITPPPFSARAISAPFTWRGPASPRNCSASSASMERPVAPTGWPLETRPPEVLTGSLPSGPVAPDSMNLPPSPSGQKRSISHW